MSKDIRYATLGEIGPIKMCKRVLKSQTNTTGGVPFYKIATFGNTADTFITEELYQTLKSNYSFPKKGAILISAAGTLGRTVIFDGNPSYFQDSNIVWIEHNEKDITEQFLYYYYQLAPWKKTSGSTIDRLYNDNIRNTPISYPQDIAEQKKITSILKAIDDKIELNNKINAGLETLAKTIYDYWFVQFEFPDENGKPYKSNGGKMEYNEQLKREIPEGWSNGNLTDIANILMGQSPSGDSYNETGDGTIFFQGRTDFGDRFPAVRMFTTSPSRIAQKGDILLSVRAPVGDINIASEECCIGRGLSALNSKTKHNSYLFYQMQKLKPLFDVYNGSGTTFGAINKDTLHDIKILIPKAVILDKFEETVSTFDKQIFKNCMENQQLTTLRDWLLPMLMNGQVSVE